MTNTIIKDIRGRSAISSAMAQRFEPTKLQFFRAQSEVSEDLGQSVNNQSSNSKSTSKPLFSSSYPERSQKGSNPSNAFLSINLRSKPDGHARQFQSILHAADIAELKNQAINRPLADISSNYGSRDLNDRNASSPKENVPNPITIAGSDDFESPPPTSLSSSSSDEQYSSGDTPTIQNLKDSAEYQAQYPTLADYWKAQATARRSRLRSMIAADNNRPNLLMEMGNHLPNGIRQLSPRQSIILANLEEIRRGRH